MLVIATIILIKIMNIKTALIINLVVKKQIVLNYIKRGSPLISRLMSI